MSNDYDIEIKCVFSLLDPANTEQIHIQQVNNIVQAIECISPERKRSKTTTVAFSENDIIRKVKAPVIRQSTERKRHTVLIKPNTNPYSHRGNLKKGSHDVYMEAMEKIRRAGMGVTETNESINLSTLDTPERETQGETQAETQREVVKEIVREESPKFKAFPNNKKTMNMEEFSELYQEAFEGNSIEEEVLLKCFSMFDHEKLGYLNAKMLQKVFEVFNEKVSETDVENLMKFIGCSGNKMTFNEFKDFFRKNL